MADSSMRALDMKSIEKDAEEIDEDYFKTLTKTMVSHAVKKRFFFDSFEDDETDEDVTVSPYFPKRKCMEPPCDDVGASDEFTELEQERRMIKRSLEQVKKRKG